MQRKSSDILKNSKEIAETDGTSSKELSKFHIAYNVAMSFFKKITSTRFTCSWHTLNRASFSVRRGVAMVT